MKLSIDETNILKAPFRWVQFALENTDIMTRLNSSPLTMQQLDTGIYVGKIFGVSVKVEEQKKEVLSGRAKISVLADVKMPLGLGGTYTVAKHDLRDVGDGTSVTLEFELTARGLMSLYAHLRRREVDRYLRKDLFEHIANAARILATPGDPGEQRLNSRQLYRVAEARRLEEMDRAKTTVASTRMQALMRVSRVSPVLVELDAQHPDGRVSDTRHEVNFDKLSETMSFAEEMSSLAFSDVNLRGEGNSQVMPPVFQEIARKFGYELYQQLFSPEQVGILALLSSCGEEAVLRIDVDSELEHLPWEALHDGTNFLSLKTRVVRAPAGGFRPVGSSRKPFSELRLLLVGSDPRGDLPGTTNEIESVTGTLRAMGVSDVKSLTGPAATRRAVLEALNSGEFNALHYSGHSVLDRSYPQQSHLLLANYEPIFLHEFTHLVGSRAGRERLALVMLNSCQSGMTGKDGVTDRQLSMCRLIHGLGVEYAVGMLWNIADEAGVQIANAFYENLVVGDRLDVAEAMRKARLKVATDRVWADGSWLAPVLYC